MLFRSTCSQMLVSSGPKEMFRFLDDNRSGRVNRVTFSARLQTLHYAGAARRKW